jgi:hypothetical protein
MKDIFENLQADDSFRTLVDAFEKCGTGGDPKETGCLIIC